MREVCGERRGVSEVGRVTGLALRSRGRPRGGRERPGLTVGLWHRLGERRLGERRQGMGRVWAGYGQGIGWGSEGSGVSAHVSVVAVSYDEHLVRVRARVGLRVRVRVRVRVGDRVSGVR